MKLKKLKKIFTKLEDSDSECTQVLDLDNLFTCSLPYIRISAIQHKIDKHPNSIIVVITKKEGGLHIYYTDKIPTVENGFLIIKKENNEIRNYNVSAISSYIVYDNRSKK